MKKYLLYIVIFLPLISFAQQNLTLSGAIDTALKNNFDIQIAKNNAEADKIKNTFGYAGGMPEVSGNASDNGSINSVNQKFGDGTQGSVSGINSNNINAGISASMVLFNGFKIIATKERLNSLQKQSEIQLNLQVQNTIAAIMVKYYDIIRQEKYLKIIQHSLDVSNKKLEIVNERNSVGMANASDMLQAQMDVKSAEQNVTLQQLIIEQDKTYLLFLMGSKQITPFNINDSISVDNSLLMDSITSYLNQNLQYLTAEQQIKINEQIAKEISSQRFPSIKLNTGYDYSYIGNSSGSILKNEVYGPSAGITLQIPIYKGNTHTIQKKVARLDVENAILEKENLLNSLKTHAYKTYLSYSTTLKQIESQKSNYEMAIKLVDVILQNFRANQATILDVKAAQTTLEEAAYLLINLQYSAKASEIELKKLVYNLGY